MHEEPFTSSSTRQWGFRNPAPVHPLTSTYVYKSHVQFSVLFGFRTWHVRVYVHNYYGAGGSRA